MSDNRYKLFVNFMSNELGVTKDDIRLWVYQAVEQRVDKLIGQMNIQETVTNTVKKTLSYNEIERIGKQAISEAVANIFKEDYKIQITKRD